MPTRHILLVEDDASIAFLMREHLADLGPEYQITSAASGEEALRLTADTTWDLVVTDNRMSGISGLELIEALREKSPSTLAVLVTGYGSDEIRQAAERLQVHKYMLKPFPMATLKDVIQDALAWRDSPPETAAPVPDLIPAPEPPMSEPPLVPEAKVEPPPVPEVKVEPPPVPEVKAEPVALKVTLGGDGCVGKTTLIRRLCTGKFDASRTMTIGVDFHLYDIKQNDATARLIVWDVSGQDQFQFTRLAFYRGSKAVGLVYAVDDRRSFERLPRWRDEIRHILPHVPLVLVGNKTDLERQISIEEGEVLAREWNVPFFETSCASGDSVDDFFSALTRAALTYANRPK